MPVWGWFVIIALLGGAMVLCAVHGLWFCAAVAAFLLLSVLGTLGYAVWVAYRSVKGGDEA
jgi:hypothetical protein